MATITTADLAAEVNTDTRTLRKFLRADAKAQGKATPGKGSRYAIERKQVAGLKKRFTAWTEAQAAKVEADADTDAS